jgi:alpha-D-ribose 1-methylphosphonate 5-triphosphate synthase subunit PhnH
MHVYKKVIRAQKTFRTLLQAMSRPGRVYVLDTPGEKGLLLVLQTLIDHEVTFSVISAEQMRLNQEIVKATGSRAVTLEDADFVIVPSGDSEGKVLRAKRGSLEYPHSGATMVYQVESLENKTNGTPNCRLRGPGIDNEISACIHGLNKKELMHLQESNSEYPLGVDSIFMDKAGRVMCIPRSSSLEVK